MMSIRTPLSLALEDFSWGKEAFQRNKGRKQSHTFIVLCSFHTHLQIHFSRPISVFSFLTKIFGGANVPSCKCWSIIRQEGILHFTSPLLWISIMFITEWLEIWNKRTLAAAVNKFRQQNKLKFSPFNLIVVMFLIRNQLISIDFNGNPICKIFSEKRSFLFIRIFFRNIFVCFGRIRYFLGTIFNFRNIPLFGTYQCGRSGGCNRCFWGNSCQRTPFYYRFRRSAFQWWYYCG